MPGRRRLARSGSAISSTSPWSSRSGSRAGGDCENQEDVFERAYRRYKHEVNFLAIDVRDSTSEVQKLIRDHHWTHPVGLDRDGALSNLYRVGGCPTFVYAYPGGIMHTTSIGQLDDQQFFAKVDDLIAASQRRAETLR